MPSKGTSAKPAAPRTQEELHALLATKKAQAKARADEEWNRKLYDAVWASDFDACLDALDAGADPSAGFGPRKATSVHAAARILMPQILALLLKRGAPLDVRNKQGETPLHGAIKEGNVENCQALVDARADVNAKDVQGMTPLELAEQCGRQDFVDFLRAHGAQGREPEPAAQQQTEDVDDEDDPMAEMRREAATRANADGSSKALYDAAWIGDFEGCFKALEEGANPSKGFGPRQNTPLHIAARTGNPQVLLVMLKNGGAPYVDVKNADGETPLMYAVGEQSVPNTQSLVEAKANVNAVDAYGATALDLARKRGLKDFEMFLEAWGATGSAP